MQVLQGHSPFKNLLNRFENELIVAAGKGEPALVMSYYGFKKVISLDEYASSFENIDPLAQYKTWTTRQVFNENRNSKELLPRFDVLSERVKAAFVVSDPVDWGRDIQVLQNFKFIVLGKPVNMFLISKVLNNVNKGTFML